VRRVFCQARFIRVSATRGRGFPSNALFAAALFIKTGQSKRGARTNEGVVQAVAQSG